MKEESQPLILSVSEITQAVKLTLEGTFPRVWVRGEVSNPKLQTSGHFYFSLKDDVAQISAVCFRQELSKVPIVPKHGDQILVRAEMNVYPPKGAYQLIVRELSHVGVGDQLIKLELLKQKLQKQGYFALERKRPLPRFPKRIGIVTSPTGAVIQDILNILTRRMKGFHVILNPVRVQGDEAAFEIAQAIKQFNEHKLADVLIVGRGGGSFEDLAPFNSELVATAIFQSAIPVVSAVGHETDFTVSDLVADLRAPTPSAAAEIISHEQQELLEKLSRSGKQITQSLLKEIKFFRGQLANVLRHPIFSTPTYLLGSHLQLLDDHNEALDSAMQRKLVSKHQDLLRLKKSLEVLSPQRQISDQKSKLKVLEKNIDQALTREILAKKQSLTFKSTSLDSRWQGLFSMKKRAYNACQFPLLIPQGVQKLVHERKRKLQTLCAQLEAIHPKKILAKGYSIIFSQKDGSVISSASLVTPPQAVKIAFIDGEALAEITNVRVTHGNS